MQKNYNTHFGYITRSGEFLEISPESNSCSGHDDLARKFGHTDDYVLDVLHWVKLTAVFPFGYLFLGGTLSPEQAAKLRDFGIEPLQTELP